MRFDQDVASQQIKGRVRRPEWVAHVLDEHAGEDPHAVLLHLPRGERVALSPTATRIWELIVAAGPSGAHVGDIVPILAAEYGVDPTIVDHDAADLVNQMVAGEWLEVLPDSGD
jgi:hypothetical protein